MIHEEVMMKAAIIHAFGDIPQYEQFPDPILEKDDTLIQVRAVVLENFDKMTANGTHYASKHLFPAFPAVVGHSGVGTLADGTLVSFGGVKPPYGTMAEKAVVPQRYSMYITPVPEGVAARVAAALPASALTSLLPLKYGVKLRSAEAVLINGATGVSGKVAIQIAKLLGAGRIVGTGRDEEGLDAIMQLGADAGIDLKQSDEKITKAFLQEAGKGYDIILDFLWGHPTELLLNTLVPKEAGFATHKTRFVQIGEAAGPTLTLSAETVRTSGVEMTGAGNILPEVVPEAMKQVWEWIKEHKLQIDIEEVPLKDIAEAWQRKLQGKRIVIVP
jgi:NADPH:quinone reductase-like Zn-dependent oxidoreductase